MPPPRSKQQISKIESNTDDSFMNHNPNNSKASDEQAKVREIASQLMMEDVVDGGAEQPISAYMTRQAERAEITGLSPIEEMRLAHGELAAKAAKKRTYDDDLTSRIHHIQFPKVPVKKMLKRMHTSMAGRSFSKLRRDGFRNAPTVVCEAEVKRITQELASNMDDMTAEQVIKFVQSVEQRENIIKLRVDGYDAKRIPWFLISPASKHRIRWDIFCVLLIIFNGFYIPFSVSFGRNKNDPILELVDSLEIGINFLYILDVIINFFSAYESRGRIETRWKNIAKNYFTSWFFIDFIAAIPIEFIFPYFMLDLNIEEKKQYLKLFRIIKMIRILGFNHILKRVEYAFLIKSTRSGLMKFSLLVLLTSHWFSCIFFYISDNVHGGWVVRQDLLYRSMFDQYVSAFYWSIMTMTTVGYGDVSGQNTIERGFSIFAMVVGAWIFAYGITNVVATVANLNSSDSDFQIKMDGINNFMEQRDLPMELRTEIREFFFNSRLSTESKLKNESKILSDLSALLRSKIALAINDSVLNKMPFFQGADHNFLMELALSMKMVCFPPHEEVIVEGEIGQEIFFIFRGAVEVVKDGQQVAVLGEQQYFGEMAIMNTNCIRLATVRTLCFCELRMLTRQKFLLALTHYPAMRQKIANIIHKRKQATNNEMDRRRSLDSKRSDLGRPARRDSTTPMEKLAVSIVQNNTGPRSVGREGSDLFALDPEKIVGSTMERISQMNVEQVTRRMSSSDNTKQVFQNLHDSQEVLLAELTKLEDRIKKFKEKKSN